MIYKINAVSFRQSVGEMLRRVQHRNDSIVIHQDGKPVGALVNAALFGRIRRMRDRFDALSGRIAEGIAEIDAAAAAARMQR